ncbi:tail fiber protein [Pseudoalteromonas phage vB_Pun_Y3]
MAIPNSPNWSIITTKADYPGDLEPPEVPFEVKVFGISLGPENLGDSRGRLDSRYWLAYQSENGVFISAAKGEEWGSAEREFTEEQTIHSISLTFDQLGRPIVFYRTGLNTLKLFWYDPVEGKATLNNLAQGKDPCAGFDAIANTGAPYSDAMLFYVRSGAIYMRVQRDRFEVEYETLVKSGHKEAVTSFVSSNHSPDLTGTGYTASLPGGAQVGDLAIATIMHRDTLTLPAGWELIRATTPIAGGQIISMAKCTVGAIDINTQHTFTQATSQRMVVGIAIARGASEYAVSVLGEERYTPQNKGTISPAGSEYEGGLLLASATVTHLVAGDSYTYKATGGITYLGSAQENNRLGVAWAKIPSEGLVGATLSHGDNEPSTGASLAIVVQGKAQAATYENLDIVSTGMRVDNRYQVVYRYEDDTYTPPPPVPPVPPALNGDYIYMQASTTQFGLEKPLINSAQHDDISITFNIYGVNELLETLDPKWGAYGIPIFCEGGTTTLYPIPLRYNQFIFLDGAGPKNGYYINPVRETQLRASRKFSLAFMYINNALHLILVVNGKKYAPIMPFNLSDGRWTVAITGNTLTVLNDATTLFIMEIDRGQDGGSEPGPGRFGAYNLGTLDDMWRQNFRGALYGITVNIAGVETNYPLMTQNSPTQESYPPGNNITIYNHKPANWKYMLA